MATKASAKKSSSSSKPIIAVAIGCFVLLLLVGTALSLAFKFFAKKIGGSMVSGMIESKTGVKTNLSDIEKGKMTFTDSKTGQTVTVGAQKLPENFPKDFPIYTNAKVAGSVAGMEGGKTGMLVTFTTTDTLSSVVAFYQSSFAANGWTTTSSFNTEKMQTWVVKKGTMEGSLSISADDNNTTILATLGTKEE